MSNRPETALGSALRRQGWTQRQLAQEVGISRPYLCQLVGGGYVPSVAVGMRLLEVLRLKEPWLTFEAFWMLP